MLEFESACMISPYIVTLIMTGSVCCSHYQIMCQTKARSHET